MDERRRTIEEGRQKTDAGCLKLDVIARRPLLTFARKQGADVTISKK